MSRYAQGYYVELYLSTPLLVTVIFNITVRKEKKVKVALVSKFLSEQAQTLYDYIHVHGIGQAYKINFDFVE